MDNNPNPKPAAAEPAPERTPQQTNDPTTPPLTYEQEVHALLYKGVTFGRDLLGYLIAQAKQESRDAKKLTEKCIAFVEEDVERFRALIPEALTRRESARAVAVPEPAAPPILYCDVCDTELQREACDRVRPCVKCLKAELAAQQESLRDIYNAMEWPEADKWCKENRWPIGLPVYHAGGYGYQYLPAILTAYDRRDRQAEPAPTPSRWNLTSEKTPALGEECVVMSEYKVVQHSMAIFSGKEWIWLAFRDADNAPKEKMPYWMPITRELAEASAQGTAKVETEGKNV